MSTGSLFEQLTSSLSSSMLAIVSGAILALLLIVTVAGRLFFSSKQPANKDKKSTTKKQQNDTTLVNKKKNGKSKKTVVAVSSSSPTTQSEESNDEKATLVTPSKKSTSTGKKVPANGENNKTDVSATGIKTSATKQQAPARTQNVEGQNGENKKKQPKPSAIPTAINSTVPSNKQQTPGKGDAITKVNATTLNKKQPVAINSEAKRTPTVDGEAGSDHESEGQWVTQSNKQVNNRNRNKGKNETPPTNIQSTSNRNIVSEKRSIPTISNGNTSSSIHKTELDVETIIPSNNVIQVQEPIEIYQLFPTNENRYTANDNWWKQPLNKQQTFSIDDIGEWPAHEQDEQYIVQVKRIIPIKKIHEEQNDD